VILRTGGQDKLDAGNRARCLEIEGLATAKVVGTVADTVTRILIAGSRSGIGLVLRISRWAPDSASGRSSENGCFLLDF
jgi:hypothetical protein